MIQKIENYCNRNFDKVLHFTAGLLLALPCFIWIGFIVLPVFAGILKEFYDKQKKGIFDWNDLYATILGAFPVLIILFIKIAFKV